MALAAVQERVRQRIYQQGVTPDLAADVWQLAKASHLAHRRWRPDEARREQPRAEQQVAGTDELTMLAEVAPPTAPFCHDVLLYRAFLSPEAEQDAQRWLGRSMWSLIAALGGWRRVHALPLGRLYEEATAALGQVPAFLRPPAYRLRAVVHAEAWQMLEDWVGKYPDLRRLTADAMVGLQLTAGAWLWIFHRADAEMARSQKPRVNFAGAVLRLARHVAEQVGLGF